MDEFSELTLGGDSSEARYVVRVDDGGEYLIMGAEADIETAFEGAHLPEYRGLVVGAGAGLVRALGGEDTEFVEFDVMYYDVPPIAEFDEIFRGWDDVDQGQIQTTSALEVRSVEQEPIVRITPGDGTYLVSVLRRRVTDEAKERHRLVVCPDPMTFMRA